MKFHIFHRLFSILIWMMFFLSCSRYPRDVEQALRQAGDNRPELEKVLEHYGKNPADSLKYKAACFLIANMPWHYAVHDAQLDSFRYFLSGRKPRPRLLAYYERTYGPATGMGKIQPDLHHITSGYLIGNIDFAVKIWQEVPWGKNIPFGQFCEDILPYRLDREPLEKWREAYFETFRPVIDTMACNDHPEEVCRRLIDYIRNMEWVFEPGLLTHGFGALIMLEKRLGNCKEQAEFIAYVMRSVGIPSGIDMIVQNPDNYHKSHYWNYIRNNDGQCISFDYYEDMIGSKRANARKYGKIYRKCYALQKESLPEKYKNKYIPPSLKDKLLQDVSSGYFPGINISLRTECNTPLRNKPVYLCIFNGEEWVPIAWSKQEKNRVAYPDTEPGILYQLQIVDENESIPVSQPFILEGNEAVRFLDADTSVLKTMILYRKFRLPLIWPYYVSRSVSGRFQGANRPDFTDAVTLHTITRAADLRIKDIYPEHPGTFRYVRYLSADNAYNNMAEMQFYSGGRLLQGKVIGTGGSKDGHPDRTKNSLFDGDPLTFFDAEQSSGAWAGLRLDKSCRIDRIRYIFRNDDNNIRPGDLYELLYLSGNQWLSAGKQVADTTVLYYHSVPSKTLYSLRNHTRGREERPFTYENGKQVWW